MKKKIQSLQRSAMFVPTSVNEEARTVDVIFGTETPVRREDLEYVFGEIFEEILSFNPAHIRMERINSGAPCLDTHHNGSVRSVLGIVEKAWIENNQGHATIRFSKREEVEPVWNDVKDGILKGISVRGKIYAYEVTRRDGNLPQYKAVDWEPYEISFAAPQADYKSTVRSAVGEENEVEIFSNNDHRQMEDETNNGGAGSGTNQTATDATRSATTTAPAAPVNVENERRAAVEAERQRTTGILDAVRKANLPVEFANQLIADGMTIDQARAAIIDKWAERDPNAGQRNGTATVTRDETDTRRSAMESALVLRANPGMNVTDQERSVAREYRGMDLLDMARACLEAQNVNTRGMSRRQIATAALNMERAAGMHSTSDFPIILGNTINRTLRAEYDVAPQTFSAWTRRTTAQDFREMTRAQFGEVGDFQKIKEGGEYKRTTASEAAEKYKVEKFGQIIGVTWEAIVNDDLDAFSRIPQKIAQAARRTQSNIVYGILSANPALSDGVALFHTTHKNLTGTGTAINIDSLGIGRKMIREQKGLGGKDFLNLSPSILLCGPAQEQYALQYTSNGYDPTEPSKVNPWRGILQVVVEPRITGNEWYLIVSPSQVDTVEYAFLEGEGELFTEMKEGFEVDGLQIKARMVFGAKAIDFRGMYKNAGALPS